jgi:iron-sulfur cluster repair protein YtfE (RIC family)
MVTRSMQADAVERRFLEREHREIAIGLGRIIDVAQQAERFSAPDVVGALNGLLQWLESSLEPHEAWEEEWLYPRLDQLAASPWPTRLLSFDHHQIRERIEALKVERDRLMHGIAPSRLRELPARLYGLDAIIRAHIEREDRFLLPVLDEPASISDRPVAH